MTTLDRLRLVRGMVRIRCAEETLADLYRDEQLMRTPTHFSIGQEATSVGVCAAARRSDVVYSAHRSHAPYLAKGGDLTALVAELYGKETGCARGRGGSVHLVDQAAGFGGSSAILGEMIPVAVGAAWAFAMDGAPRVALTFFGDGASEEGVFHESLNFAALHRLPVVFVCENNRYSIASPLSARQPAGSSIWQRALGYGMRAGRIDGNDVFAVHDAARTAIESARAGGGPQLLELDTYRWREHVGPHWDEDGAYRTHAEVASWMERCPIRTAADALRAEVPAVDARIDDWRAEFTEDVHRAADLARAAAFPEVTDLLSGTHEPRPLAATAERN
ncbi:thiamine pyrophosphate-dependent dehydrogenase E1 component subunit alpha [Streptomyces sp. LP05-1]|uniref:Thiamine pyrophosphate-dependent dehydrogenase E1 component subunit alpha n=1 Tax=Streptomyces pyxinae TaxID=2970734 RepID=A0ABT2CQ61_9ACTN|nr:thiamine pyrophosphate-dependent dehydrogenase E1 component subunit alpha [Streptomyces sp. LP05-1]MCS0639580.1 thiamine pyrophosphate-dependent dehydrogenase E1 component subunit alpha [Streptomyces sp. LP05-1]